MASNASTAFQKKGCLGLGPTFIGTKSKDMGNGVFDNTPAKLKDTELYFNRCTRTPQENIS